MVCTSSIPAARAGDVIPDVSLYDHSKATAALATAIYLYHQEQNSLQTDAIRNDKEYKFLMVNGNFQGIQNFIFKGYGDTKKYRSKILRGRSFAVSLLSELAADMICREIELPFTSVILGAAGGFTILAPNIPGVTEALKRMKEKINDWLFDVSYGETVICFSSLEASCDDFVSGNFIRLWGKKGKLNEETKFSRINLDKYGGAIEGYLNSFNNTLEPPLCHICGKRPATRKATESDYVKDASSSCDLCRDHVFLGTKLAKEDRLAIVESGASTEQGKDRLLNPVFGKYQVIFPGNKSEELIQNGKLLKYWDINFSRLDFSGVTVKFINGYVPVCRNEDRKDKLVLTSAKADEILEDIWPGAPKSLTHIACKAKNPAKEENKFCGMEALGVLKADVDNLGILMACGLKPEQFTLSRLATLSRQLNSYFAVYLPNFLMNLNLKIFTLCLQAAMIFFSSGRGTA